MLVSHQDTFDTLFRGIVFQFTFDFWMNSRGLFLGKTGNLVHLSDVFRCQAHAGTPAGWTNKMGQRSTPIRSGAVRKIVGAPPPHPNSNYFNHAIPVGHGARPLGMGEAFVALADDFPQSGGTPPGLPRWKPMKSHWMGGDRVMNAAPFTGFARRQLHVSVNQPLIFFLPDRKDWGDRMMHELYSET